MGDHELVCGLVWPPQRFRLSRQTSPARGGVCAESWEKLESGIANSITHSLSSCDSSFVGPGIEWPICTPSGSQVGGPVHQSVRHRLSIVPTQLTSKV